MKMRKKYYLDNLDHAVKLSWSTYQDLGKISEKLHIILLTAWPSKYDSFYIETFQICVTGLTSLKKKFT